MGDSAIVSKQFKIRFIRHKARTECPKCGYYYYESNLLSYSSIYHTKIYKKIISDFYYVRKNKNQGENSI